VVVKGERLTAKVQEGRRLDIARNHTATHLLHRTLQKVVGQHVRQAGSLVSPERLRFDFTHLQPVTVEELRQIEREVNAAVRAALPVEASSTTLDKARASGAMALFGEKYGDVVRMICVGDSYSRELCGGTHLHNTGQIGFFHILGESSVGSGLRRIEAITGRGAEAYVEQQLEALNEVAVILQTKPEEVVKSATEAVIGLREQQRAVERLRSQAARERVARLVGRVKQVDGVQVLAERVEADSVDRLREMADQFREKLGSVVIVLGAVIAEKPMFVAAVTPDLVKKGLQAGKLVGQVARAVGGGGGGSPSMAQAGGKDASKLDEALAQVPAKVQEALGPK